MCCTTTSSSLRSQAQRRMRNITARWVDRHANTLHSQPAMMQDSEDKRAHRNWANSQYESIRQNTGRASCLDASAGPQQIPDAREAKALLEGKGVLLQEPSWVLLMGLSAFRCSLSRPASAVSSAVSSTSPSCTHVLRVALPQHHLAGTSAGA